MCHSIPDLYKASNPCLRLAGQVLGIISADSLIYSGWGESRCAGAAMWVPDGDKPMWLSASLHKTAVNDLNVDKEHDKRHPFTSLPQNRPRLLNIGLRFCKINLPFFLYYVQVCVRVWRPLLLYQVAHVKHLNNSLAVIPLLSHHLSPTICCRQ